MEEVLYKASEELKRIDHLIYVSLKYTRTVDIIRHTIERIISAYGYLFDVILINLNEQKLIDEVPIQPLKKCKILEEHLPEDEYIMDHVSFFRRLKKVYNARYDKRNEFRRHVTMTSYLLDETIVEINMDIIHEYFDKTKEFKEFLYEQYNIEEDKESFLNKGSF